MEGNLFWEYLFRITLLIFWHTDLLSKSMPFIVQFSVYVYIICLNWAQAQRVGSGNDLTPTAVSKSENTLKPVLQPNGLLAAAATSCPTAAWTTWNLLYCSSLQENRGVDFHTVVSVDEYSHSSDHLRALSSTKVLCLWPPSWDYRCASSRFQPSQATGDFRGLVFLRTGQAEESCFPRRAQVPSERYQHHAEAAGFSLWLPLHTLAGGSWCSRRGLALL